jgi:hypothetical protein
LSIESTLTICCLATASGLCPKCNSRMTLARWHTLPVYLAESFFRFLINLLTSTDIWFSY